MPLNYQRKQLVISEIHTLSKDALSAVIANFCGISAEKMTELRKICREAKVHIRVVRNTLLRLAVEGTCFKCLKDAFTGPIIIAYSMEHPGTAARILKAFSKINKKLEIKAAAFNNEFISSSQIDRLATLPTQREAIIRLIIIMKEITTGKLIRALIFIRDKKGN